MHAHILSIDDNLSKISPSRGPHLSPFISLPSIYSYIQPLSTTYQVPSMRKALSGFMKIQAYDPCPQV